MKVPLAASRSVYHPSWWVGAARTVPSQPRYRDHQWLSSWASVQFSSLLLYRVYPTGRCRHLCKAASSIFLAKSLWLCGVSWSPHGRTPVPPSGRPSPLVVLLASSVTSPLCLPCAIAQFHPSINEPTSCLEGGPTWHGRIPNFSDIILNLGGHLLRR